MTSLELSRHAQTRSQQRSLPKADMELVWQVGTVTGPDCVTLRNADVDREIRAYKAKISRLERLRGVVVIAVDTTVVTAFRPTKTNQKRHRQLNRTVQ
jgi:hypothetical protein